jgi:hypothetical protein
MRISTVSKGRAVSGCCRYLNFIWANSASPENGLEHISKNGHYCKGNASLHKRLIRMFWMIKSRLISSRKTYFVFALSTVFFGVTLSANPTKTGKEIYDAACSSCHGLDGTGQEQSRVGFDLGLPDFTDCFFSVREPNADWIAVAHDGGPARKFSHLMPAFGGALTVEEIELAVNHMRTFCTDDNFPRGELNLPRAMFTEKAFPEDELVYTIDIAAEGPGAVGNEIIYEKRFGARNQLELLVPFGWEKDQTWNGGIGDVGIGVKRVMFHDLKAGSIFSLTGEVKLPTGNEERGFGKGAVRFEPFASIGQVLPSEFFLHGQAGLELSTDREKSQHEGFWRFALGRSFTQGEWGRAWSPMVEVLGAKEFDSHEKTQWDIVPQVHITLNTRQQIMMNFAVRFPITDSQERSTTLLFFLLWDWFDGGLFDGW